MDLYAVIALILSGGALAVSIISLYFSVFFKRTSLIGCLASWNPRNEIVDKFQVCEVSLSNTGNRELVLRDIDVSLVPELDGGLMPVLDAEGVPLILKPGQIRLLSLPIPSFFLSNLYQSDQRLCLEFHFYTTDAKLRIAKKALSPPQDNADIPEADWELFSLQ